MKRSFMVFVLASIAATIAAAQSVTWKSDQAHSNVTFSVNYMVLTEVTGNFKEFDATMTTNGEELANPSVKVAIKTSSINTENERRDGHLRSADFFESEKYPEITFVSRSFEKGEGNQYKVTGDLTMHGVTKSVTIDARYMGQAKDMRGNLRVGFKGTTTVNRTDYGVKYNATLEGGGLLIGNDVTVTINAQFIKQQEEAARTN